MKRMLIIAAMALTACGADDKPAETPAAKTAAAEPAPAPAPAPAPEAKPAAAAAVDGKAIYNQYCVACHGPDGKGNNGLAASYVDDPSRLAQTDEALIKSIKEGKQGDIGVMPPWGGTLNDEQITAVIGHIRAEFGGAPAADAKPE